MNGRKRAQENGSRSRDSSMCFPPLSISEDASLWLLLPHDPRLRPPAPGQDAHLPTHEHAAQGEKRIRRDVPECGRFEQLRNVRNRLLPPTRELHRRRPLAGAEGGEHLRSVGAEAEREEAAEGYACKGADQGVR